VRLRHFGRMQALQNPLLPPLKARSLLYAGLAIAAVTAASFLGAAATTPGLAGWYESLRKPRFNPPNWVFPVVWTPLFALMAFAFWRVLRRTHAGVERNRAVLAFSVQLAVNVAWSFVFFGMRSIVGGIVVAAMLVGLVIWMILTFRRVDPLAASTQLPYLAWGAFALVLNVAIWQLN
jgi:translocator protein